MGECSWLAKLASVVGAGLAAAILSYRKKNSPPRQKEGEVLLTVFSVEDLHKFCKDTFASFGVPEDDAILAADVLSTSDRRGIESHGIARLHTYFELLQVGRINVNPKLRIVKETPSTATVDGDNGLGLVVGPKANRIAMQKAKEVGSGWVTVLHTNHYGIAGYYSLEALKQGMMGISMTNTTPIVAPLYGKRRMLGTNPIACAFPTDKEPPVVVDMATSCVAYGKVEIARRLGEQVPAGWCIDGDGQITTDPQTMISGGGACLPLGSTRKLGGHKGYCLASMVDILCGVLSGANWGPHVPPFALRDGFQKGLMDKERPGKGIGHFFGCLDVAAFQPLESFSSTMDDWVQALRSCPPADPSQPVQIPGDPERLAEEERSVHGVPLPPAVVADMEDIVGITGITMPAAMGTRVYKG